MEENIPLIFYSVDCDIIRLGYRRKERHSAFSKTFPLIEISKSSKPINPKQQIKKKNAKYKYFCRQKSVQCL